MPKTLRKNSRRRSKRSRRSRRSRRRNNRKSKSLRGGMFTNFKLPEKSIEIPDIPPATPVPSTTSVPLSVPDLSSEGVLGQLGEQIRKNPYTSAGLALGAAGAAGLGYYLSQDSEGVKNAKDYIKKRDVLLKKTQDVQAYIERLEDNIRRMQGQIRASKLVFANEVNEIDRENMLYNQVWRDNFLIKVNRELGDPAVLDRETIIQANREGGSGIDSIPLYNEVMLARGHIRDIKGMIATLYPPGSEDIAIAPFYYQQSIRYNPAHVQDQPLLVVPAVNVPQAVAPPAPPAPPPPNRAPPNAPPLEPEFLNNEQRQRFAGNQQDQALYRLYQSRWNAWNTFVRQNPGTVTGIDGHGNHHGGVSTHPPPNWEIFVGADAELIQSREDARAAGAEERDIIRSERSADNRDPWTI